MPFENTAINMLIIDDEQEACNNLKTILDEYIVDVDLTISGMAHNTARAEELIQKYQPDAIFLDIDLPKENAFQFLDRMSPISFEVIFITAYDEFAIRAFKINAIDYILKPISITELQTAIKKLKDKLRAKKNKTANTPFTDLTEQISGKTKLDKVVLRDNNNVEILELSKIIYIEADGSYSKVVFVKNQQFREIVMSYSIAEYEELLPADLFFRIHKSFLINCKHINNISKEDILQVSMQGKYTLPISRRRFNQLIDFLKTNMKQDA